MYIELEESDLSLLQMIYCRVDDLYDGDVEKKLRGILISVLATRLISLEKVYRLLELLPQFKTAGQQKSIEKMENDESEWREAWEDKNMKYKRACLKLHQRLNNLAFMQAAMDQKKIKTFYSKKTGKIIRNNLENR